MTFIYNAAFLFFGLFYLPVFILKTRRAGNPWALLGQRLGILDRPWREKFLGKKVIWIHAVSVGEVMAAGPFLQQVCGRFQEYHFVLTTVTVTGQAMARKMEGKNVTVCYFPFDFTFAVRSFFRALGPEALLLMETEIWPNLLTEARNAHVPVGILNARLSEKSFSRYRRVHLFMKGLFEKLDFVLAQTPEDAERFTALGVPQNRVSVFGNLKFDAMPLPESDPAITSAAMRSEWGFRDSDLIFVAGSTHPGEEALAVDAFCALRERFPALKCILAPRHIERAPSLERWLERRALAVRRATDASSRKVFDVLLVDCLGVLKNLYAMADVVFVGGSFVKRGGQNPIEPAGFKRAVLHGPNVQNFHAVYRTLDSEGGALRVRDADQFLFALRRLLEHPEERQEIGRNAFASLQRLRGATERHLEWLAQFLNKKSQMERIYHADVS